MTNENSYSEIIGENWPVQLAFLSCSSTSIRLLKLRTRMTFWLWGALAILLSSFTSTSLPIPSATTFVHVLPTVILFSRFPSTYIYTYSIIARELTMSHRAYDTIMMTTIIRLFLLLLLARVAVIQHKRGIVTDSLDRRGPWKKG